MVTREEFRLANERGRRVLRENSPAVKARYDRKKRRVVVTLNSGVEISFSPEMAQGLEDASDSDLSAIEITPPGLGLYFPRLDADLYVPALVQGLLGSRKWMAARLGEIGGRSTSRAKRRASQANGRLGGRPKKAGAA